MWDTTGLCVPDLVLHTMSQIKQIVLDANILIRAVLGEKVPSLLECHSDITSHLRLN